MRSKNAFTKHFILNLIQDLISGRPCDPEINSGRRNLPAFTLAEVLITLGIIGVVAAMTIPTLMNNTRNKETVTAVKKSYSVLSQAYALAVQDNGTPDTWGGGGTLNLETGANLMINTFAPYLKYTKNCGTTISGCFPDVNYKYLSGTGGGWGNLSGPNNWIAKAQLADGSLLSVVSDGCDAAGDCGYFAIDVNGFKRPNQLGMDYFFFRITQNNGLIPFGVPQEATANTFDADCKDKSAGKGWGCTAWVIYNENMDYLKCSDLSWSGKHKCG